jgi:hypothetical protein
MTGRRQRRGNAEYAHFLANVRPRRRPVQLLLTLRTKYSIRVIRCGGVRLLMLSLLRSLFHHPEKVRSPNDSASFQEVELRLHLYEELTNQQRATGRIRRPLIQVNRRKFQLISAPWGRPTCKTPYLTSVLPVAATASSIRARRVTE